MQSFNISRTRRQNADPLTGYEKHMEISLLVEFRGNKETKLYIKDFAIHAINSVGAALSTQNLHISGSTSKSKWRFSSNGVSNVS